MWIDKLIDGVLEVDTPIGPRFIQPNLSQRAYLIWTFRNFASLPQQVLRPWQRRLIDRLRNENKFVSTRTLGAIERPVIGKIERRTPQQAEAVSILEPASRAPGRKPMSTSESGSTDQSREAASA
jgi:hypothetical protein